METEQTEVSKEVKSAARLLDRTIPGWHKRIDLDKLNMGDCTVCMLGQTFGVDAELGIAKELYPEEWKEAALDEIKYWMSGDEPTKESSMEEVEAFIKKHGVDGYSIGLNFFRRLRSKRKIGMAPWENLDKACDGRTNECEWAAEITDRLAKDEDQPSTTKRKRATGK